MASDDLTPSEFSSSQQRSSILNSSVCNSNRTDELLNAMAIGSLSIESYSIDEIHLSLDTLLHRGLATEARSLFQLAQQHKHASADQNLPLWSLIEARILFKEGNKEQALEASSRAVNILKNKPNRRALAEALHFQGQILVSYSRFDAAVDALSAALHIYMWELNDLNAHIMIRNLLALVHKRRGKWAVAEDVLERTVSICEEHEVSELSCRVLQNLGVLYLKSGKVTDAITVLKRALLQANKAQHFGIAANVSLTLAIHERMAGHFAKSRRHIREVKEWSQKNNQARTELLCYEYLADIRHDEGFLRISLRLLNRALRLALTKWPDTDLVCEVQRRRAEVLVELRKPRPARRAADDALRVSQAIREPFEIALAYRASATVSLHEGDRTRGLDELCRCEEILRQLGEKFELGRTLLHRGAALIQESGFAAGSDSLDEARKLFSEMGLAFWVRRTNKLVSSQCRNTSINASSRSDSPEQFGIITRDDKLSAMFSDLVKVASTNLSVILEGESGTGKELFAQALHRLSPRASRPFFPLNCGAIPKEMQESELFGHRRGSFTGAFEDNPGLLESVSGGTLFLDEIGEMSESAQVKLLRAIESSEIRRMGERQHRKIDVRYVAATNVDLAKAMETHRFRSDLYYRLSGMCFRIPPLRERRADIPLLIEFFVDKACKSLNKQVVVSKPLVNLLMGYEWPGNIRELKNSIERAVALANPDSELGPNLFSFISERQLSLGNNLDEDLEEIERQRIIHALEENGWVKTAAARALNITRTTLTSRMDRLGIPLKAPARRRPPR
jgi:two-component system, NtrC family, response regulator HydG